MGAYFGGQNRLGIVLPDDIFIQIGGQLFGLQIKMKGFFAAPGNFLFFFILFFRLREKSGGNNFHLAPVFAGQVVGYFLFQVFLIGEIGKIIISHGSIFRLNETTHAMGPRGKAFSAAAK